MMKYVKSPVPLCDACLCCQGTCGKFAELGESGGVGGEEKVSFQKFHLTACIK